MREIKFRCIHKNGGRMDYGYEPLRLMHNEANGSTISNTKTHHIMQYTGLHDKNGKEIYEFDILRGHTNNYLVFFEEGSFTTNVGKYILMGEFEIIGNRFEHPELIY